MEYAALLSKHTVTLVTRKLAVIFFDYRKFFSKILFFKLLSSIQESTRVKSGAWDLDNDAFIYTTSNHIKYALTSGGDHGIIRTMDIPVYILALRGNRLYCLNRFFFLIFYSKKSNFVVDRVYVLPLNSYLVSTPLP